MTVTPLQRFDDITSEMQQTNLAHVQYLDIVMAPKVLFCILCTAKQLTVHLEGFQKKVIAFIYSNLIIKQLI